MYKTVTDNSIPFDLIRKSACNLANKTDVVYIKGIVTYCSKLSDEFHYKPSEKNKTRIIEYLTPHGCFVYPSEKEINISALYEGGRESEYNDPSYYVYVFGNEEKDLYKIGYTRNIRKRFKRINQILPFDITIYYCYKNRGRKLENELHRELSEYNVKGEWFKLPIDNLFEILDSYNENNIRGDEALDQIK